MAYTPNNTNGQTTSANSAPVVIASDNTLKTNVVDGTGAVQGPIQTVSGVNYAPVTLASGVQPGNPIPNRANLIAGSDGTNARALSTDTTGKLNVNSTPSNILNKFRDAFEAYVPNGPNWTQTLASNDLIQLDGNSAAASYLVISKCPITPNTESNIATVPTWNAPFEASIGLSMSQRTLGQEFSVEYVSTETPLPAPSDLTISTMSQTTTTLTVSTSLSHGLRVGMRIGIRDCLDSRMNYPALVVATTPSDTQFTATAGPGGTIPSLTAGPFTSGFVYFRSVMGLAPNGSSQIFENATVTNASFYVRSESGEALPSGTIAGNQSITIATTASVQAVNAARNYSFQPTNEFRIKQFLGGIQYSDVLVDSLTAETNRIKRTQVVPNFNPLFRLRIRATNNSSLTRPIAQIVSATKTGTTTATVVTDVAHGLTTGDIIQAFTRDTTNFANLAAIAVASVVDATTFTVVWGGAVTATSYGGAVVRVNGGTSIQGLITGGNVQSISRTSNIVTVVGSATLTGVLIGDYINLYGCRDAVSGASLGIDGPYRVRNIVTTTAELEPIGSTPTGADIISTNCGGLLIKRTDMRLSFVRALDFERQRVEMLPRPQGDISEAASVNVQNVPAVSQSGTWNIGTITTLSAITALPTLAAGVNVIGQVGLQAPVTVADVVSAALITSTTTAAITPTFGTTYSVNIPVTAVTGTTPTLDFRIEESLDSGTNWRPVYDFPRITATGFYQSPVLTLTGNRVRYVQTVGGTTPSFTRAVNRLQNALNVDPLRQQFDRSIVLTTLNSTTPALLADGSGNVMLTVNVGAITTTAPQLILQASDDNGATFYDISTALTAVASSTVSLKVNGVLGQFVRARVSTAGVGVTAGYVMIRAWA
jgi:hypothetical protein